MLKSRYLDSHVVPGSSHSHTLVHRLYVQGAAQGDQVHLPERSQGGYRCCSTGVNGDGWAGFSIKLTRQSAHTPAYGILTHFVCRGLPSTAPHHHQLRHEHARMVSCVGDRLQHAYCSHKSLRKGWNAALCTLA